MTRTRIAALLAAFAMLSGALGGARGAQAELDVSELYKDRDVNMAWDADEVTVIDLDKVSGDAVTLTEDGDYLLSGTLSGQIIVNAGKDAKIRLILNGVTITGKDGPAVWEKQGDKLIVTLVPGTENSLTAGSPVSDNSDMIGAALYAEDDLSINGEGSLTAVSAESNGIQSKADLIVAGGRIQITSGKDGLRGRNSLLMLDGSVTVASMGDGFSSNRNSRLDKGWILIAGGTISIVTGGGAGRASASSDVSRKGVKAETSLTVLDGTLSIDAEDDGLHAENIAIRGGTVTIATGDEGIQADSFLEITGGTIEVSQAGKGRQVFNP